ncbi:MAG: glycosyltransferase family 4 protein, partial [Bacteroidota bacterium]
FYLEYNWKLWRHLRKWPYDLIYSVDLDTLLAGTLLTRGQADKKLVFDAHEWFSETPEVVSRPLIRAVWRGLGKGLVPMTDTRFTVGPMLAGKLSEEYGCPFATVRSLPLRQEVDRQIPAKKIILYQGMLNPGRGLETAITAMAELPDCELWLVGSGPEVGALRRCSEQFEVQNQVKFLGFRPPAELPALTQQAWLGLNLLDAVSPSYYYSLANKALDYVQAGVPSVQMDFPEYRTLNEQYGCYRLLPELNPLALAEIIRHLAEDQQAYQELQERCLRAATELCWEQEEEVLLEIIALA